MRDDDNESTDLGLLWEQALNRYYADTGTDIKSLPQKTWSVAAIINDQERQVNEFTSWRHNKGAVDKLRSAISRNSDIVQSVAQNLANAASASFPPSAAIMTAFTYVMKASKNISEDYDLIIGFFDLMNSFLERVSLLESKLPSAKTYQAILMRVFSSLLILCGIASREIKNGRFRKFFKTLIKGNDDELKSSYDTLERNIQRLESATMFATLATTIETKNDVKDVLTLTKQHLKLGVENLTISTETSVMVKESMTIEKEILRLVQQGRREQESKNDSGSLGLRAGKLRDSGAKKSVALNHIKTAFANSADPALQFREIQTLFVTDTFDWLSEEESYENFIEGKASFLWIYGAPGMGKSCLTYSVIERLRNSFCNKPRTSVVYFFFREEHEELRSVKNMLSSAVIELGRLDGKYRDEAAADILREGTDFEEDDGLQIWARFFASKYPKGSEAKLFLVLDGLDEADASGRATLFEILQQIRKDDLSIQVVLSSRPDIEPAIKSLQPVALEITRTKIGRKSGDLWKIIMARCKSQSKLRRLKVPMWKKIAARLRQKADTILYVEHMLRRLNGLGRESLIIKELENLPSSLREMYSSMLSECQKHRSEEHLLLLRKLFAWLAYSKRPLRLGEATNLVALIAQDKSFVLEEEIDGRSSRILQLTNPNDANEDISTDDSDDELTEKVELQEESVGDFDESKELPLMFQDRSLRQFFREMEADELGLRSTPPAAHLVIFEMLAQILTVTEDIEISDESYYISRLQDYAATFWLQHFLDIDTKTISERDTKSVIESLYMILSPNGKALKYIENVSRGIYDIFGGAINVRENFFKSLQPWSERVNSLPLGTLSADSLSWMRESAGSPKQIMLHLAKCHMLNWFSAVYPFAAGNSYLFAENALRLTDVIPELSQMPSSSPSTEKKILMIANAFKDTPKTSNAYRAIGITMSRFDLYDAALAELAKSLEKATSDLERFYALFSTASIGLDYAHFEDYTGNKEEQVGKAYEAIIACLDVRPPVKADSNEFKDIDLLAFVRDAIIVKARCEVSLGKIEDAMRTMEEAKRSDKEGLIGSEVIDDITAALEDRREWSKIITVIEKCNKWDLMIWLGWDGTDKQNDRFQHAAKECDKQTFLVQTYDKIIVELQNNSFGSRASLQLAKAHRNVFQNFNEAKRLLQGIADGRTGGPSYTLAGDQILEARLELTEVHMEEFRATTDPKAKLIIFNDLKRIVLQDRIALADDFNPYESQTAVPIALMARKVGPPSEFQDGLEKTFNACVEALKDDEGWNDRGAFRMLAKVLACVPKLERDAQISFSLQFSKVDPDIDKTEEDSVERTDTENTPNDEDKGQNASGERQITQGKNNASAFLVESRFASTNVTKEIAKTDAAAENHTLEGMPAEGIVTKAEPEEDLWNDPGPFCNACSRVFPDWTAGSMYLCVICTDCDLCEDDYEKRVASNRGEEWQEWKTFCGPNHRYIRGPIAGWKGVKNGVIRIGEEQVSFEEWLRGLSEERWTEAWVDFWRRDESTGDIL